MAFGLLLGPVALGILDLDIDAEGLRTLAERGWISDVWIQVPVVATSVACFALAQTLRGSGFIAAFSGGLLFGALCRKHKARFMPAAEDTGETFALLTWVVFGAAVVGPNIRSLSLPVLGYAILRPFAPRTVEESRLTIRLPIYPFSTPFRVMDLT